MSNASREASAQRDADDGNTNWNLGRIGFAGKSAPKGLQRATDLLQTLQGEPHISWPVEAQNLIL